ncbi:MAG: low molecular weight protein-tyrosine-phosphatase [Pseudomonadales bacterium]
MTGKTRVLFVCLGNICRSPTAHAVFAEWVKRQGLAAHIDIDSCGTGDWHVGRAPDERAVEAAARRGYDLAPLRARQIAPGDFYLYDLILAMDEANLRDIRAMQPDNYSGTIDLFLRYAGLPAPHEVPDPYYGGENGFSEVLGLVEQATEQLLLKMTAAAQATEDPF